MTQSILNTGIIEVRIYLYEHYVNMSGKLLFGRLLYIIDITFLNY